MALYHRLSFLKVNLVGRIASLHYYKGRQGKVGRAVRTNLLFPLIACRNDVTKMVNKLQDKRYVDFHTRNGWDIGPFIKMMAEKITALEECYDKIRLVGNLKMRGE